MIHLSAFHVFNTTQYWTLQGRWGHPGAFRPRHFRPQFQTAQMGDMYADRWIQWKELGFIQCECSRTVLHTLIMTYIFVVSHHIILNFTPWWYLSQGVTKNPQIQWEIEISFADRCWFNVRETSFPSRGQGLHAGDDRLSQKVRTQSGIKKNAKTTTNSFIISRSFASILDTIDWMDPVTKKNAHEKLKKIDYGDGTTPIHC